MKYSLTLIEWLTIVVFIGILLMINMPMNQRQENLLAQEKEIIAPKSWKCQKL